MGTVVFVLLCITEVALAAYSVRTSSNQRRLRSWVRVGALGAFILFTLLPVIEWSFRWYALAALLLVSAALGAWRLVGKRAERRAYSTGRVVAKAAGTLLLTFVAVTPVLIFPQYRMPKMTGVHKVATVQATYVDGSRIEAFATTGENRKVNVQFWYPEGGEGPYPLVVFSPGSFGPKTSNTSTYMELASHGYVVCSIDHPYHAIYTVDTGGHLTTVSPSFIQAVTDANNGKYDGATSFALTQEWLSLRTRDITFVLDTITHYANSAGSGEVYHRLDLDRIGLIGHSLGAAAGAQVARERAGIDAVINLDADLIGEYHYAEGTTVVNGMAYPVPLLSIYSDDMVGRLVGIADPDAVVAAKHLATLGPDIYEVHIAGTNHMSLTDLPLHSPFFLSLINTSVNIGGGEEADAYDVIETMNDLVLAFFNAYLKDESGFAVPLP